MIKIIEIKRKILTEKKGRKKKYFREHILFRNKKLKYNDKKNKKKEKQNLINKNHRKERNQGKLPWALPVQSQVSGVSPIMRSLAI